MSQQEEKLQTCQIQVQPVDDGFVIQAINLDAAGRKARRVASDLKELRLKLSQIVETLFEPVPEKAAPPTAEQKATPGGPAGTKSPS